MDRALIPILLASAASAVEPEPAPLRVAVYELALQGGVDRRPGSLVTEALLAELRKHERLAVLGMSEVQAMLSHEANRQLVGCQSDESCMAEIAGALGVDALVAGSLGRVGDTHLINAKRIEVRKARVANASARSMPVADGQEFLSVVDQVAAELFPEYPLREGAVAGVNPEMVRLLNPPPLPAWVFWTTSGAGIVLTSAGAVFGVLSLAGLSERNALFERSRLTGAPVDGAVLQEKDAAIISNSLIANALFAAVGAALIGTAVEALFTDWYGYRDWRPGHPVPLRP
jgi:hypothetical protein